VLRLLTSSILSLAAFCTPVPQAFAQVTDGASFAELSLRSILSVSAPERRGARRMLSQQVSFLPSSWRNDIADFFFAQLQSDDPKSKGDILFVLGEVSSPWTSSNVEANSNFLYQLAQQSADDALRLLADTALANARGLYKDGIRYFNSTILTDLTQAEPKLRAMATNYPKSRYAERASFYLAQYYAKRFVLKDPVGKALVDSSNLAYEDYIKKVESSVFSTREYLAGGYYYRGLNSWLVGDMADAKQWLNKGLKAAAADDQVYIYQLFVSRERAAVIDRYIPAGQAFSRTLTFLNQTPAPSADRALELAALLRQ
jgi:hypothetical protein